jgi:hypothetical protein
MNNKELRPTNTQNIQIVTKDLLSIPCAMLANAKTEPAIAVEIITPNESDI